MMLRQDCFTKAIRRLLRGGIYCGWHANASQSPVLPRAWLAYDACLNAGSTAVIVKLEPSSGVAPG